ncbi:MAG: TlpA family protein disulfide reductase [Bacteroidales bacterium]|nr:TlpA family protein disulfide reductase [Bacteroidales bacterium]
MEKLKQNLIEKYKDRNSTTISFYRKGYQEGDFPILDTIVINYSGGKKSGYNFIFLYNKSIIIQRNDSLIIRYKTGKYNISKYSKANEKWIELTNLGNPYFNSKSFFHEFSSCSLIDNNLNDSMIISLQYQRKMKGFNRNVSYTISLRDTSILHYKIGQKYQNGNGSWEYEYTYFSYEIDVEKILGSMETMDSSMIYKQPESFLNFSVNDTFPDFPFINLSGDTVFLTTDKQFILLDFWYIGCVPCKEAIPEMNNLQKEFPNVKIIGVNSFQKNIEEIIQYQINSNIDYEIFLNTKLNINFPHPAFILIDKHLNIKYIVYGFNKDSIQKLRAYILANSLSIE